MWKYNYSPELYHSGIKGQKWGLRRYQNSDGTYTEEGKRRRRINLSSVSEKELMSYSKIAKNASEMTGSLQRINSATTVQRRKKKLDLSKMSDKELRDKINRELLERQYNDIFNPKTVSKGREYLRRGLEIGGGALAATASAASIALAIKQLHK